MLDKLCKKILNVLCTLCKTDSYVILEISEILTALTTVCDSEVLHKYMDYLVENEYVDIKYYDDKQICLALLPKARGVKEEENETQKFNKKLFRFALIVGIVAFACAFVGALIGALIGGVVR